MPNIAFVILLIILVAYLGVRALIRPRPTKGTSEDRPTTPAPALKFRKLYHIDRLPEMPPVPSDESLGIERVGMNNIHIKPCLHMNLPRAFVYEVYGLSVRTDSVPRCPDCTQELLEALFEKCAECGKGIAINTEVCIGWIGSPHPFTHPECAESKKLICGVWGHGRLIRLDQLKTGVRPGTATVMQLLENAETESNDGDREEQEGQDSERLGPGKSNAN